MTHTILSKMTLGMICLRGAVIFVVFGLVDPELGIGSQTVTEQGLDVMVMLDVSQSMQVEDVE